MIVRGPSKQVRVRDPLNDAEVAVVNFFLSEPSRADWIRQNHVPDAAGRCAGCRSQTGQRHPCSIRRLADESVLYRIPRPRE